MSDDTNRTTHGEPLSPARAVSSSFFTRWQHKMRMGELNRTNIWFLVTLTIVGVVLLVCGVLTNRYLMTVLGSVILSAGASLILGRFLNQDTIDDLKSIIRESLKPDSFHAEHKLDSLPRILHLYHATVYDGKTMWCHSVIDFSRRMAVGRAVADIEVAMRGQRHLYRIEAGRIDTRMILLCLSAPESDEPCAIFLFPFAGYLSIDGVQAGVVWHMTWDKVYKEGLSRTLVSCESIVQPDEEAKGYELSEDEGQRLDEAWEKAVSRHSFICPRSGVEFGPTDEQTMCQNR